MRLPKICLLAVLVGVACSSGGDPYGTNPPPPPPPPPGPGTTNAVDVTDDAFSPSTTTVNSGTTVTWTWRGYNTHSVTFQDGQSSSAGQTSGNHTRNFAATGTFRYRCTYHSTDFNSGMVGSVVVQ
jgi:plastocyanin